MPEKQYIESYEYAARKVTQANAGYDPLGMTAKKGCANCKFFVSPTACTIVDGDISPTGLSTHWAELVPYVPDPIPVRVVSDSDATAVTVRQWTADPSVLFTKQADGRTRFLTYFTNNFEDRHHEIISLAAHKEFVEWSDNNNIYPELWLWHTPGSRFGQVDWLEVNNGFLAASGLIDEGKEYIAEAATRSGAGMSHGFLHVKEIDGTIPWYVTYEISVLPLEAASNPHGLSFTVLSEEVMAFSEKKKEYFNKLGLSADVIGAFEKSAERAATVLKDAGIAYKEAPDVVVAEGENVTAGQVVITEIQNVNDNLATVGEAIKSFNVRLAAAEKSFEEGVDARIQSAVSASGAGYRASTSDDNVVKGIKEASPAQDDWFGTTFNGAVKSAFGG